jgi:hypothetical protein
MMQSHIVRGILLRHDDFYTSPGEAGALSLFLKEGPTLVRYQRSRDRALLSLL